MFGKYVFRVAAFVVSSHKDDAFIFSSRTDDAAVLAAFSSGKGIPSGEGEIRCCQIFFIKKIQWPYRCKKWHLERRRIIVIALGIVLGLKYHSNTLPRYYLMHLA